ncbi:MAG: electron transfer flavoprotein subunit alpha/FixB family protein [Deltaproteobacteria bacterium]|nr:electron transfer flavoprotein subunit alpha/FixB family protein [Deltaproteobacteria bacterium]
MGEDRNVLVYAEGADGSLGPVAKEVLGCGRRVAAALGQELHAVVLGSGVSSLCREAGAFGADRVYAVDHESLREYEAERYALALLEVLRRARPRVFLMGNTGVGQDLSPRAAYSLGTSTVLDCVEVAVQPGSGLLLLTKPVFGGKALARFVCRSFPQMATVRPKSTGPAERDASRTAEVVAIGFEELAGQVKTTLLERVAQEVSGMRLEDADVVVAGGRGVGGADGFAQLEEAAKTLRGAVGASRAATDEGWAPTTVQIGLTGKIVAPRVYLAVALSGSSQHLAGCSGSEAIVAFNKDRRANIFREARFGVVGDWRVTVPAFLKELEELSKS